MTCNCDSDITKKLKEYYGKDKEGFYLRLGGYVMVINRSGSCPSKAALPVTMEYKATRKNGQTYVKKEKTNMIATYCPFCGVKYDEITDEITDETTEEETDNAVR